MASRLASLGRRGPAETPVSHPEPHLWDMKWKTLAFSTGPGPRVDQREEDSGVQTRNAPSGWQGRERLAGPPLLCPGRRRGAGEDARGRWLMQDPGASRVYSLLSAQSALAADTG